MKEISVLLPIVVVILKFILNKDIQFSALRLHSVKNIIKDGDLNYYISKLLFMIIRTISYIAITMIFIDIFLKESRFNNTTMIVSVILMIVMIRRLLIQMNKLDVGDDVDVLESAMFLSLITIQLYSNLSSNLQSSMYYLVLVLLYFFGYYTEVVRYIVNEAKKYNHKFIVFTNDKKIICEEIIEYKDRYVLVSLNRTTRNEVTIEMSKENVKCIVMSKT